MSANLREGRCKYECRNTYWRNDGTAGPGDVRRCKHGRIWQWKFDYQSQYFLTIDRWTRLSRFWEPMIYRRAVRALTAASSSAGGER